MLLQLLLEQQALGFVRPPKQSLVFVQQVFRHGARYPIYDTAEPLSGQLTAVGYRQHYLLGKALRQRYVSELSFISKQYNPTEVYVKSTPFSRTIQSAESHLYGLFQDSGPLLEDALAGLAVPPYLSSEAAGSGAALPHRYQPISIESNSSYSDGEFLRGYDPLVCPNQAKWVQDSQEAIREAFLDSRVQAALTSLGQCLNRDIDSVELAAMLDNQISNKYLGIKYCPVVDEQKQIVDYVLLSNFLLRYENTTLQKTATASALINRTFSNFQRALQGDHKFILYSAHDYSLLLALAVLGLADYDCLVASLTKKVQNCITEFPPYASNLIFEFWKARDDYTVKIIYNGRQLTPRYCSAPECTLGELKAHLYQSYSEEYPSLCGVGEELYKYFLIGTAALSLVLGAAVAWLGCVLYRKRP